MYICSLITKIYVLNLTDVEDSRVWRMGLFIIGQVKSPGNRRMDGASSHSREHTFVHKYWSVTKQLNSAVCLGNLVASGFVRMECASQVSPVPCPRLGATSVEDRGPRVHDSRTINSTPWQKSVSHTVRHEEFWYIGGIATKPMLCQKAVYVVQQQRFNTFSEKSKGRALTSISIMVKWFVKASWKVQLHIMLTCLFRFEQTIVQFLKWTGARPTFRYIQFFSYLPYQGQIYIFNRQVIETDCIPIHPNLCLIHLPINSS